MKKESKLKSNWKKDLARDFISLGGLPFFAIVLVRVYILEQPNYFSQFVIAGIVFLLSFIFLKQNVYSGLALIALYFTANHYQDIKYTIFGTLIYFAIIGSLVYLKEDKKKVILGIVIGAIGIFISRLILA